MTIRSRALTHSTASAGALLSLTAALLTFPNFTSAQADPFVTLYRDSCSVCHGESLEGAAQGTPLIGAPLKQGDSIAELTKSIGDNRGKAKDVESLKGVVGAINQNCDNCHEPYQVRNR